MLMKNGDDNETWISPTHSQVANSQTLQENASLRDVSNFFHLNRKQHKMFVRAGSRFLQSLVSADSDDVQQMIGFLGGLPGEGKSLVIEALQNLAKSWNSEDALETVAYQGVAAQAANGQTIHKLFQWGVQTSSNPKQYTSEQKERFARLKMLIMDEVSTTDVKFIGMIDRALRELRNKPDIVFGGVHSLFVGDWLQQLPVAGHPAFIEQPPPTRFSCRSNDNDTSTYFARLCGIKVYRQINEVVMLRENMRHRCDPTWAAILDHWRYGQYNQNDIDYVNQRCYIENWNVDAAYTKAFCPIIVTSNTLRCEFNEETTAAYCRENSTTLHKFQAKVFRARFQLTQNQQRSLRHLLDDKTGNVPIVLSVAIGMPVQCTQNVSRALRLANGTIGHVVSFQAAENDVTRTTNNGELQICIHSEPPAVIFMKLLRFDPLHSIVQDLPPGIVPVKARDKRRICIHLPDRSFNIRMFQVPLVAAFSLTSEKCQGLTVEKLVIRAR